MLLQKFAQLEDH